MMQQLVITSMAKWNDCNDPRQTDTLIMHLRLIPQEGLYCIRLKVINQNFQPSRGKKAHSTSYSETWDSFLNSEISKCHQINWLFTA